VLAVVEATAVVLEAVVLAAGAVPAGALVAAAGAVVAAAGAVVAAAGAVVAAAGAVVAAGFVAAVVAVALLPPQAASTAGSINERSANDVIRPHFRPLRFQIVPMIASSLSPEFRSLSLTWIAVAVRSLR